MPTITQKTDIAVEYVGKTQNGNMNGGDCMKKSNNKKMPYLG